MTQGLLVSQLTQATHVMSTPGVAGWREHKEFIQAWNAGLDWFINFTEGERFYQAFVDYVEYLQASDYENLPAPNGWEPDGETFVEVVA